MTTEGIGRDRLHLGCGKKHIPGFYHIDALPFPHVDLVGTIERLPDFGDGEVSLIYACHVLEHIGRAEVSQVLREWFRVLKNGGALRLAVPDFAKCVKLYNENKVSPDLATILGLIVGGQRDSYDFHKMIFDERSLTVLLKQAGFKSVARWDWRATDHSEVDDYSQAYIPHMEKETGELVSLNLEAIK